MSSTTKITLKSSDGKTFEVDEAVVLESETIKLLKDDFDNREFHLEKVTSAILAKVIEYCKKHVDAANDDNINAWDAEFLNVDTATLFDLVLAADYLKIKSLLDLTCQAVADMIKGKTREELGKIFYQVKSLHSGGSRGNSC